MTDAELIHEYQREYVRLTRLASVHRVIIGLMTIAIAVMAAMIRMK